MSTLRVRQKPGSGTAAPAPAGPAGRPGSPARRLVDVLGVDVTAGTISSTVATIGDWIAASDRRYVCVTGVHGVMEAQRHPDLAALHNAAGLVVTDGMPLVWACKRAGHQDATRVYGPDLLLATCDAGQAAGWRHYFYGAAPGVPEALVARLHARFPALHVAGTHSPPYRSLTAKETIETAAAINASGADIVWVGLSTPKQERWMAEMRPLLTASVLIGVGAAFDIHAGRIRQAPPVLQNHGLEWAFRLAMEPRRLWRRYLRNNPAFVLAILRRPPRAVIDLREPPGAGRSVGVPRQLGEGGQRPA